MMFTMVMNMPALTSPLNKLAGTVHGAVEISLLADILTPPRGFRLVYESGVQVGLDGHLLAGHGIKGKTCRHFRDTRGTAGDNHFVQNEQNKKKSRYR